MVYFLQSPICTRVNNLDYIVMILTPMESWCWSCFARERGLVNGSATFRSICILQISMSRSNTWWRMELKRLLMCLVFLWNLDSFAKAITPVLSQKIFIGPDALGMTPRSDMNSFNRCFRSSYVLFFTCRSRHDALFGTAPAYCPTVGVKIGGSRVGGPELCV